MKATYVIVVLMLLILIAGLGWVMSRYLETAQTPISENEAARFADATKVIYQGDAGEISVEYISNLARVTGGAYNGVVFRQTVSASGAKYEGQKGVILWTKNNEVRIETPQQVVYTGTAVPVSPPEPIPPVITEVAPLATSTATTTDTESSTITEKTWVWESALRAGETVVPKKAGAFSLTFTTDGSVTGTTDCNGFGGNYTKTDNEISLGALRMTLMFCENSEESLFIELVESPLTIVTVTESALELKNAVGDTIRFSPKVSD
jgi:heat shock protein HslJ/membrane-bound inhibitor of C-type lysozyme